MGPCELDPCKIAPCETTYLQKYPFAKMPICQNAHLLKCFFAKMLLCKKSLAKMRLQDVSLQNVPVPFQVERKLDVVIVIFKRFDILFALTELVVTIMKNI